MTDFLGFFAIHKDAFIALGVFIGAFTALVTSFLTLRSTKKLSIDHVEVQKDWKRADAQAEFRSKLTEAIARFFQKTAIEKEGIIVRSDRRGEAIGVVTEIRMLTLGLEPESSEISDALMSYFLAFDQRNYASDDGLAQIAGKVIEKYNSKVNTQ